MNCAFHNVYNQNNTYHDVEREIALSRRAFVLGMPTAISFGIVSVGDRYGAMYELVNAETMSECIARAPQQVDYFGKTMAEIAHNIYSITVSEDDEFPDVSERISNYIELGIASEDEELAAWVRALVEEILPVNTLIHGDFHTGNVFLTYNEPMLIDMDRVSRGHPIVEIADEYYFYVVLGENDPSVIEDFMGFTYETAQRFFRSFLINYLGTEDETKLNEVIDKAAVLCCTRMIRKLRYKKNQDVKIIAQKNSYIRRLAELKERVNTLKF